MFATSCPLPRTPESCSSARFLCCKSSAQPESYSCHKAAELFYCMSTAYVQIAILKRWTWVSENAGFTPYFAGNVQQNVNSRKDSKSICR